MLSLRLFHRVGPTLCRDSTAVDSLIADTVSSDGRGDGKRSAGGIDHAITPAPV
jgi:hypothetical protein